MRLGLLSIGVLFWFLSRNVIAGDCDRIVSLAPSVSETLFAVGLGTHVVGVTRYCRWPEETRVLPKVGGLLDLNFEAIIRLRPTMVFGLREQAEMLTALGRHGMAAVAVDHRSITSLLESIHTIGRTCSAVLEADKVYQSLSSSLLEVRQRSRKSQHKRVLLAVGRTSAESLATVFISGRDGFYNELLQAANAENVYSGPTTGVLALSPEAFILFKPDYIIEIVPRLAENHWQQELLSRSWSELPLVRTLPKLKIRYVEGNFAEVPGPRFIELLQALEGVLRE